MRRAVEAGVDGIEHARMEVAPGPVGLRRRAGAGDGRTRDHGGADAGRELPGVPGQGGRGQGRAPRGHGTDSRFGSRTRGGCASPASGWSSAPMPERRSRASTRPSTSRWSSWSPPGGARSRRSRAANARRGDRRSAWRRRSAPSSPARWPTCVVVRGDPTTEHRRRPPGGARGAARPGGRERRSALGRPVGPSRGRRTRSPSGRSLWRALG